MLQISDSALENMINDAVSSFPDECCGFMFGTEDEDVRKVREITIVANAKEGDKRRRFQVSPVDYMKAEHYAEANGFLLLGIYHSHPNHPAIPSEHDRVAAQPYFSYVILSILDGVYAGLRSWRLNEEALFVEETINDHQTIQ
ncbi:MAG TPA: M67 family metallopeptidase [Chitinophagaceae bacterium]|nr:M67 family metallopeptidase [Chitinophagaceae bacterium]